MGVEPKISFLGCKSVFTFMKRPYQRGTLMKQIYFILLLGLAASAQSQTLDFIRYVSADRPPLSADFVIDSTQDVKVGRVTYTPNVDYRGVPALLIERWEGVSAPDTKSGAMHVTYDDTHFYINGNAYRDSKSGTLVDLPLTPSLALPRQIVVGESAKETSMSSIAVGPIKADVTVDVEVVYAALETLESPLGRFENALRVEFNITASIGLLPLGVDRRTEWYHPLAGLIQIYQPDSGKLSRLNSVSPPVQFPVSISDWRQLEP